MTVEVLTSSDGSQSQEDAAVLILEVNETVEQLLVVVGDNDVLEVPSVDVLVTTEATAELLEAVQDVEIIEVGIQGPPGIQGVPGTAAAAYLTLTASGALGGHRVVVPVTAGVVEYADNTNPAHANSVLGITIGAAADGAEVYVQTTGELTEPSWNWTLRQPVFLSTGGLLTQTYPTTGFALIVGVPTTATTLMIGIKSPFVLEA